MPTPTAETEVHRRPETLTPGGKGLGLMVASVLPAALWTALLAVCGQLTGSPFGTAQLMTVGLVIAGFLAVVTSVLMARP